MSPDPIDKLVDLGPCDELSAGSRMGPSGGGTGRRRAHRGDRSAVAGADHVLVMLSFARRQDDPLYTSYTGPTAPNVGFCASTKSRRRIHAKSRTWCPKAPLITRPSSRARFARS